MSELKIAVQMDPPSSLIKLIALALMEETIKRYIKLYLYVEDLTKTTRQKFL